MYEKVKIFIFKDYLYLILWALITSFIDSIRSLAHSSVMQSIILSNLFLPSGNIKKMEQLLAIDFEEFDSKPWSWVKAAMSVSDKLV